MNRTVYYVITLGISLSLVISFFVDVTLLRWILAALVLLSWILPKLLREEVEEDTQEQEEEVEDSHPRIPGYEKSGLEIKGCYNCFYSRDIENQTFVFCNKFQQKVYRDFVCNFYKT